MSHDATGWAIKQRGLKPAAKIVLWQLCDRFHPDNGCFPSQDTLAADCEMSRSSVNEHLAALESAGLIAREERRDERTKRQKSTRYRFAFEAGFEGLKTAQNGQTPCPESGHGAVSGNGPEPCPENGQSRVQNPDTNLVREPVKEPERESAGEEISGEGQEAALRQAQGEGAEGAGRDDQKSIERWLKRHHPRWPSFVADSGKEALKAALALTPEQRAQAAERLDDYLATEKALKGKCAFSVYLGERRWERLPAPSARPISDYAPPFGPVWAAWRTARVVLGAEHPDAPTVAERWPLVAALDLNARLGRGHRFGPRWHAMKPLMEPVPVGSPTFVEWRALFEQRGWPWLPDPGDMPVVYFPAGGPEGIEAFEQAVREAARGGERSEQGTGKPNDAQQAAE